MDRFLVDFSVNMYETIAGYALIFSIFRFSFRGNVSRIFIAAIAMAQTSFLLREYMHWEQFTPLFMLIWIVLLLWRMFQIHLYYSLLMAVTGYLAYIAIQFTVYLAVQTSYSSVGTIGSFDHEKVIQILSSTIAIGICLLLTKWRIGFSFVPDRANEKIKMQGINRILMITVIGASVLVSLAAYRLLDGQALLWIGGIAMITIFIILNLSYIKERKS